MVEMMGKDLVGYLALRKEEDLVRLTEVKMADQMVRLTEYLMASRTEVNLADLTEHQKA